MGKKNTGPVIRMESAGFENLPDKLNSLLMAYHRKLIEKGFAMSRRQLKQKDMMDLRALTDTFNHDNKIRMKVDINDIKPEYVKENGWYCFIPCFNEGVLWVNTDRYIYYKIKELDVQERSMTVWLQDYESIESKWQIGVDGNVCILFPEKEELRAKDTVTGMMDTLKMKVSDYHLFAALYKRLDYKELGWSKSDISLWESHIVRNAKEWEGKINNMEVLSVLFLHYILMANQELFYSRPSADRKANTQRRKVNAEKGMAQPEKLVRTVGRCKMTSKKPPRMPCRETVVHYKTAVWKARGGVRHMKDGRLIPFRESIRHRKCLQDKDNTKEGDVPQSTLRFTKPGK